MILVGRYLSPFVRRVGISLTLAGLKFDRLIISALDRVGAQARSGLEALNAIVPRPYLAGPKLTQADVAAAVLFGALRRITPHLVPEGRYKRLEAHARKMEKLTAFRACRPEQL